MDVMRDSCLTGEIGALARRVYGNRVIRPKRKEHVIARFLKRIWFVMQPASWLKTKTITKRTGAATTGG